MRDGFDCSLLFLRLKKSESEVSAEERERTKRLVYASLYGAGAGKLREILGVSHDQALHVAASFHSKHNTNILCILSSVLKLNLSRGTIDKLLLPSQ